MKLSSNQLEAFVAVAKAASFSRAAESLHITQSALSQRILNLESQLETDLFVRDPSGVRLTDIGQNLLRYCHVADSLEADLLDHLGASKTGSLGGLIRIGGYSTVVRSLLIPSLAKLVTEHPNLQLEVLSAETRDLIGLLKRGAVDFILTSDCAEKQGLEIHLLGHEEYVLVEPKSGLFRQGVYLDHDPDDQTTFDYLRSQGMKAENLKRTYLDEIYAIIDGVTLGLGRAVLPRHLVKSHRGLRIVKSRSQFKVPIYLVYHKQAFFTSLQKSVINVVKSEIPMTLISKSTS